MFEAEAKERLKEVGSVGGMTMREWFQKAKEAREAYCALLEDSRYL
jgi:hypothetical protein